MFIMNKCELIRNNLPVTIVLYHSKSPISSAEFCKVKSWLKVNLKALVFTILRKNFYNVNKRIKNTVINALLLLIFEENSSTA